MYENVIACDKTGAKSDEVYWGILAGAMVKTSQSVPLSTPWEWEGQIKAHVKSSAHSVYVYREPMRELSIKKLAPDDVILMTYHIAGGDLSKPMAGGEVYMIHSPSIMLTNAMLSLNTQRRWAVTSTPIQKYLAFMLDLGTRKLVNDSDTTGITPKHAIKGDEIEDNDPELSWSAKDRYQIFQLICDANDDFCSLSEAKAGANSRNSWKNSVALQRASDTANLCLGVAPSVERSLKEEAKGELIVAQHCFLMLGRPHGDIDLIEIEFKDNGITFVSQDANMTRTQINRVMENFEKCPEISIILISIMAGGLGLHLVANLACKAHITEP
ncbi:hypothetical protein B9Z19DRAFT_1061671 [Tuber borchii]|uniref:SNF2 N-terminal domain-containing protein n=1 Tax=Tuber borchii TaxID=42251 RepID=A0A2T7A4H1_TUBBO|nr:hypothetical protein B9Z19DRAFT_1061671 [Tuber borchii]